MDTVGELKAMERRLEEEALRVAKELDAVRLVMGKLARETPQIPMRLQGGSDGRYKGWRLADAIRDVLQRSYPHFLYPREIKTAVLEGGFIPTTKNFANVLRSQLWHLAKNGGSVESTEGDGGNRYRLRNVKAEQNRHRGSEE
ncbi:hypothetical protein K8I61_08130 [bacterium]|nr:hypothetical protein [bacterium]